MNIYKILSASLAVLLCAAGVFYGIKVYAYKKMERNLNNQIAKLEGAIKETETVMSRRAIEVDNIKLENKELRSIVKNRDEDVVALTKASLKWKDMYLQATHVTESLSFSDPRRLEEIMNQLIECEAGVNPVELCKETWKQLNIKVDFKVERDPLEISGHTNTNPPSAVVNVRWLRDIELSLVLTKDKNDLFRVYLDSNSKNIVPADLKLTVDPDILDKKWYEKINIDGSITVGQGVASQLSLRYDVFDSWSIGPSVLLHYDGEVLRKTYGISTTWYPFRW